MAKNKFFVTKIIDGEKSRILKELIVDDMPSANRCSVSIRDGKEIHIKEYHYCGGGEFSEVIRSRYNKRDSMYSELNAKLLAVGL